MAIVHPTERTALIGSPSFDPAEWLERFKAVGGFWICTLSGSMSIGWFVDGYTIEQNIEAAAIWRELGQDDERASKVCAHLIAGRA